MGTRLEPVVRSAPDSGVAAGYRALWDEVLARASARCVADAHYVGISDARGRAWARAGAREWSVGERDQRVRPYFTPMRTGCERCGCVTSDGQATNSPTAVAWLSQP